MALTYPWKDCPWAVRHRVDGEAHPAWRMRAFIASDFRKGKPCRNDFIIKRDGTPGDRTRRPRCETCGQVPLVEDLVVIERSTGDRHFLEAFNRGLKEWGCGTRDDRCWWCQSPKGTVDAAGLCPACAKVAAEPAPAKPTERAQAALTLLETSPEAALGELIDPDPALGFPDGRP